MSGQTTMWSSSSLGWIEIGIRHFLALALVAAACSGQMTGTSTTPPPDTTTTVPSNTITAAPPTSEEVAVAFFEAWQAGDRSAMEALAEPNALAQADDLADLADDQWQFDHCEGTAGTIFCVWASETDQLAIGVRNIEEPHLVASVGLVDV